MNETRLSQPPRLNSITSSASISMIAKLVMVLALLLSAGSVAAKQEKMKVCHVSSDGKINLLVVSPTSFHVGNPTHYSELLDFNDYEPGDIGANGEGTEDSNGDGIDDGCEPPAGADCPCFDSTDLQVVTAENHSPSESCSTANLPLFINIKASTLMVDGLPGMFFANAEQGICFNIVDGPMAGDPQEIEACVNLIAARCAEVSSANAN